MANYEREQAITSPEGEILFPHLNKPDVEGAKRFGQPVPYFKMTLRLPNDEAQPTIERILAVQKRVYEAAVADIPNLPPKQRKKAQDDGIEKAQLPFDAVLNDQAEETGQYDFRFKLVSAGIAKGRNGKPDRKYTNSVPVYDATLTPTDVALPLFGARGVVSFFISGFYSPTLGVCVTLKLSAVQVTSISDGGRSGRDPASLGFTAREGGFVASEYEAPEADATATDGAPGEDFAAQSDQDGDASSLL